MRYLRNNRGIALVMALILAAVSLAFASALLYMSARGTKMSGLTKRYKTSLGASKGGVEIASDIINKGGLDASGLATIPNSTCLDEKLYNNTGQWVSSTNCAAGADSEDPTTLPDITLSVGTAPNQYNIFIKIIDTVKGNSPPVAGGSGTVIDTKGVVESGAGGAGSGTITPPHMPFLYTVVAYSQNATNADENAWITFVYAH